MAVDAGTQEPEPSAATDPPQSDAVLARRAQILATEHWGLLAARGTAQSEVLTRITIFLTLVSAGLVTIGLLGQASGFAGWFAPAALSILAFLVLVGLLTQIRVFNVAEEDMTFVVAMNRLRGAYVDLDPGVERYFLQATTDDEAGMVRTYSPLLPRSDASQVLGGSAFLIVIVNACVLGLLAGGLVAAAAAPTWWAITFGVALGMLLVIESAVSGYRRFRAAWRGYTPLRSATELPEHLRPAAKHTQRRSTAIDHHSSRA